MGHRNIFVYIWLNKVGSGNKINLKPQETWKKTVFCVFMYVVFNILYFNAVISKMMIFSERGFYTGLFWPNAMRIGSKTCVKNFFLEILILILPWFGFVGRQEFQNFFFQKLGNGMEIWIKIRMWCRKAYISN